VSGSSLSASKTWIWLHDRHSLRSPRSQRRCMPQSQCSLWRTLSLRSQYCQALKRFALWRHLWSSNSLICNFSSAFSWGIFSWQIYFFYFFSFSWGIFAWQIHFFTRNNFRRYWNRFLKPKFIVRIIIIFKAFPFLGVYLASTVAGSYNNV